MTILTIEQLREAFRAMDEDGDVSLVKPIIRGHVRAPGRVDIFLDTETSGLSKYDKVIQLAYVIKCYDEDEIHEVFTACDLIDVKCTINPAARKVHGITRKMLDEYGQDVDAVYSRLKVACNLSAATGGKIIAFNAPFDKRMMGPDFEEYTWECALKTLKGQNVTGKMSEIYKNTFGEKLTGAHDAIVDVRGLIRIWEHFECHV